MTKQEIMDIIKSKCIPIYDDVVGYDFDWIADTLLAMIDQEKKDTLKEFVEDAQQRIKKTAIVAIFGEDTANLICAIADGLDDDLEYFLRGREK